MRGSPEGAAAPPVLLNLFRQPYGHVAMMRSPGSHADLVPMVLDLLAGVVSTLALVESGCSDTEDGCAQLALRAPP